MARTSILDALLTHIATSAINDLLIQIITCEATVEGKGILEVALLRFLRWETNALKDGKSGSMINA